MTSARIPRTVALTGASGNIGAAVLDDLIGRGCQVIAVTRSALPEREGLRQVIGDLTRPATVADDILSAEAVIHCASPRSDERRIALDEDVQATATLLDLWHAGPFVLASSQTVYGVPNRILRETDPLVATNWYDLAKICNEQQLGMKARAVGWGAGVSLRLPLVFGAGPRRRDRQFLPTILDTLLADHAFVFNSEEGLETHGSTFIDEADVGRAIVDALRLGESGPYNVSGGFCTWRELIETMGARIGVPPRIVVRAAAKARLDEIRLPQSRSELDSTVFDQATGFSPRGTMMAAIERFIEAELG